MSQTVLCIDGDSSRREETEHVLRAAVPGAVTVVGGDRLATAAAHARTGRVDCLVTEYALPDGTGLEAAQAIRDHASDAGVVLYTATDPEGIRTDEATDLIVELVDASRREAPAELGHTVADILRLGTHAAYPITPAEGDRLEAVARYAAVIEDARESLERLKDLARSFFETSVAFVSLLEAHEQRYVVQDGLPADRLAREETVCTYTTADGEPTAIEDLKTDELFAGHDTLHEVGLRSYAGVPLESSAGHVIGTLCVMDDHPRSFSPDELEFLQTLADEVMSRLELQARLTRMEAW